MNTIAHTSKTVTLANGRIKRDTPVIVIRDFEYGKGMVQCRRIEDGKMFVCDRSDLRGIEEAGA